MELTVLDWNVKGRRNAALGPRKLELIHDLTPDVLLLQEVTPAAFAELATAGWSGVHALQFSARGAPRQSQGQHRALLVRRAHPGVPAA